MSTKINLMCDCNIIHENKVKESKKNMLKLKTIEDMSNFFKILGEPTRIKILNTLDNNEMCVCDIANVLNMTKSTISHQLNILRINNIVRNKKNGKEVYYTLDDEHVKEVFEIALSHIGHKGETNEKI